MRLRREEKETHIWTNEAEDFWEIESSSSFMWARLDKTFKATEVRTDRGRTYAKCYKVPLNSVSVHKPRVLTEAQRVALVEARAKARAVQGRHAKGAGKTGLVA